MDSGSKRAYLEAVKVRYISAKKYEKTQILNEFCKNCNYNRKYAIRLISQNKNQTNPKKRSGRKKKYHRTEIITFLQDMLKATNLICSKRLKAVIPLWIPYYEKNNLTEEIKQLILEISPATIDRLLSKYRHKFGKIGLATTKPGSILKKRIPIKTNQWDESRPGFLEADTVAHCGNSIAGSFVYTVNIVDIATGWTEQRAVWGKGQNGVFRALQSIEEVLPFKILGFDSDNGSEFINYHIEKFFTNRKKPVQYTRSRPYQKNDNAHIEQKNWTNIRQYLGYSRFDNPEILPLLSELYTSDWRLFFNFFLPSVKLIDKQRIDGKIVKIYDHPKTPFQRLKESGFVKSQFIGKYKSVLKNVNPYLLQKTIKEKIINILKLANHAGFK